MCSFSLVYLLGDDWIFNSEQVSCKSFKIVTIASEGAWTLGFDISHIPFPSCKMV